MYQSNVSVECISKMYQSNLSTTIPPTAQGGVQTNSSGGSANQWLEGECRQSSNHTTDNKKKSDTGVPGSDTPRVRIPFQDCDPPTTQSHGYSLLGFPPHAFPQWFNDP